MSLLLPDETLSAPTESANDAPARRRITWIDVAILALVLGTLGILSVLGGMSLSQAAMTVGVGGGLTVELRRRLS